MTYLEFLKEFSCREVVYSIGSKSHSWTTRDENEFDVGQIGRNCGLINNITKKGITCATNYRIKTTNKKLIEILSSNKIIEHIYSQPFITYSLNTQSLQNILWILYKEQQ